MPLRAQPLNAPPGRVPLLGDALSLRRHPLAFLESLRGRGDLAEIHLGPQRVYLPTNPELTEAVLVTRSRHFQQGAQYEKLRPLIGNGLASSEGEYHRRQRALVRQAFGSSRLPGYLRVARDVTASHCDRWDDRQELSLDREMYRLAASIATRILYNDPIDQHTAAAIDQAGLTVVRGLGKRVLAPFGMAERLPTPANRRYGHAVTRLHGIVDRIIATRRVEEGDHGDLLSVLLRATDPDTGEAMTDQQVHDEATTMLGGATESTAVSLSWTLYEIARHPRVEQRVREELGRVVGNREISADDIPGLEYAKRVVDETLRLEGPAWMLTRRATTDVDLAGHRLAAGSPVWFSPYLLHHDPAHFPDPARFEPDRWLQPLDRGRPRCSFIPFGAGLRVCIGEQLARAELLIVLGTLLQRWHFRLAPGHRVDRVAGFVLGPDRLPVIATRL
jgi:cytochrome P450